MANQNTNNNNSIIKHKSYKLPNGIIYPRGHIINDNNMIQQEMSLKFTSFDILLE